MRQTTYDMSPYDYTKKVLYTREYLNLYYTFIYIYQFIFTGLLRFDSNDEIVTPNQKYQLDCGIKGDYYYCVWEKNTDIIQVINRCNFL